MAAQADYNTRRAGITSAIVVAILIPVGICGFCLLLKLRQNAAEKREDNYYDSGTNRFIFTGSANIQITATTMEKELLFIIESLEHFCNILLGFKITIHSDHKNLSFKPFKSEWH